MCGSPAATQSLGPTNCICFANCRDDLFMTGGNKTLRVWEIDEKNHKIRPKDCNLGPIKRIVNCIQLSKNDQFMYCGTTSGDVLRINTNTCYVKDFGPQKEKFSLGIKSLQVLPSGNILLGTGDGVVAELEVSTYKKLK